MLTAKYLPAALLMVAAAYGQADKGSLVGTVVDGSGDSRGRSGRPRNRNGTRIARSTVTNETGNFTFPLMDTGNYALEVSRERL